MQATIYQPTKNSMQSGMGKAKYWLLKYTQNSKKTVDPLMGWVSSSDTTQQIKLKFNSLEEATNYAKSKNINYTVIEPQQRKTIIKNYADNFKYKPL